MIQYRLDSADILETRGATVRRALSRGEFALGKLCVKSRRALLECESAVMRRPMHSGELSLSCQSGF